MNPQEVLESSIVQEPPPFPSIDELIVRERRRRRAYRAGTAVAGASGVVAAVLGVTLVTGQLRGTVRAPDTAQPPATSAPVTSADQPAVAPVRLPLLSLLFTTRLSSALPDAELVRGGGSAFVITGGKGFGNEGDYLFVGADAVVDPSPATEDVTRLSVSVFEPLTNAPLPTENSLGALYGGCAGIWRGETPPADNSNCQERTTPFGSTVFYGWRDGQGTREIVAVMTFPDGVAVRVDAYGKPDTVPITASALADVLVDPRYAIPAWGPQAELAAAPTPTADFGSAMVECLAPKGWDVHTTGDGYGSAVPREQHDQYELDVATCRAQFDYGELVTAATANSWYDQIVASADCLRGQGYSISEPPSREAYVDQLLAKQLPDWDPYAEVFEATGGPGGVREAGAVCPHPTSW